MYRILFSLLSFLCFITLCAQSKYDLIVATDGSGQFTSIQAAILSVRDFRPEGRTRIFIKKGVYREKVVCPSWKSNISLIGEDRDSTILIYHDHAKINNMGTSRTYTLKVEGEGFHAQNLTIQNDAPQLAQAVALHVEADKVIFRNCRLLGFQDTVYNGREDSRQLFIDCYIEGTVDYIFGPATVWFERCTLHSLKDSYLTAASTPQHHKQGFIFNNCQLTAAPGVSKIYLGRPWRPYSAVLFMNCKMGEHVRPQGWDNWRNAANEKTARYQEFGNTGKGADRKLRVSWSQELSSQEAALITPAKVFERSNDNWIPVLSFEDAIESFLGKPYIAKTLDRNPQEQLVVNVKEVDCTTFVEYVLAEQIAMMRGDVSNSDYCRTLQMLRYRNGRIQDFSSRLNYFSEWISDNARKGLVHEITSSFAQAQSLHKNIHFMSSHPNAYPALVANVSLRDSIFKTEQQLNKLKISYIPKSKVSQLAGLQKGDLIAITTSIEGLDIQHVGFAYPINGVMHLLHASSTAKKVIIDPLPLADFLLKSKTATGIRVIRLKQPSLL